MSEEKKLTGYPSMDKPWLKYYSEEAINAKLPECTIYEYLWENNKDHLNDIAIVYIGRKISYRDLFNNIDRVAKAFSGAGIGEGDFVTIIAPSIPEVIYSFYALNKIGAISNFIDPRKSSEELDALLAPLKTKACIILDDMWEKFFNTVKKHTSIMISVAVSDSLPAIPKIIVELKSKTVLNDKVLSFRNLLKNINNATKLWVLHTALTNRRF